MAALRMVECVDGPMDGARLAVPAETQLPDMINFPSVRVVHRDVYRLVAESAESSRYRFDHTEVSA